MDMALVLGVTQRSRGRKQAGSSFQLPGCGSQPLVWRRLHLTTLLWGQELLLSFLPKTKATGFYLRGESGFCEMQKASAPGQGGMRLGGLKGTRLLPPPPGIASLPASACHTPCPTPCTPCPCPTPVPHVHHRSPGSEGEGRAPISQRAGKGGPWAPTRKGTHT